MVLDFTGTRFSSNSAFKVEEDLDFSGFLSVSLYSIFSCATLNHSGKSQAKVLMLWSGHLGKKKSAVFIIELVLKLFRPN